MSNFIDLETVGCDDHHNRRIAELSGSAVVAGSVGLVVPITDPASSRRIADHSSIGPRCPARGPALALCELANSDLTGPAVKFIAFQGPEGP